MREDDTIRRIQANEDVAIEEVCKHLQGYTKDIRNALADLVASLCDISKEDLLKDTKHLASKHARWLYWYAYRQMTGESYETMSQRSKQYRRFAQTSIGWGVANMSMMIAEGTIWTKRYTMLRKVIQAANRCEESEHLMKNVTVKVIAPKGINVEIKQE